MQIQVREAKKEDEQQMFNLYNACAQEFVGPALRNIKTYKRMVRRKGVNYVAVDKQGKIVGYVSSRFDKARRQGRIEEIVVHPNHDFEQVAQPLVNAVYQSLVKKKSATIVVGTIRNPQYEKIFPALGFLAYESDTVFMYTILNAQKFLNEIAPIFVNRLKKMKKWNGLAQMECEGHSIFIQKTAENVEQIVWTNQPVDCKVTLNRETMAKLIFSVADPIEFLNSHKLNLETTSRQEQREQLLRTLFPRRRFLIIDHW